MHHENIRKKAEFIDRFIELYRQLRKRKRFPHNATGKLILLLFPNSKKLAKGAHKTSFSIQIRRKRLALKISERKDLRNDFRAYRRLPITIRNRYFAKMYWATKHCLLQKLAKQKPIITKKNYQFLKLKKKLTSHHLTDIRPANVGWIDGKLKVLDANIRKPSKYKPFKYVFSVKRTIHRAQHARAEAESVSGIGLFFFS